VLFPTAAANSKENSQGSCRTYFPLILLAVPFSLLKGTKATPSQLENLKSLFTFSFQEASDIEGVLSDFPRELAFISHSLAERE